MFRTSSFLFLEITSLFMACHPPLVWHTCLYVYFLNATQLLHTSDTILSDLTRPSQTWHQAPRSEILCGKSPVIHSGIRAAIIEFKGTAAILRLSFRVANNEENDEGSNNVTITGSDPRLMRIWCMVEERSDNWSVRGRVGKTAQLSWTSGKILLLMFCWLDAAFSLRVLMLV